MTSSEKNEKALAALRYALLPDQKSYEVRDAIQEAIAIVSQPATDRAVGFEQIGWTWKTGSAPFLWTEFREMKDLSRVKAEELKAEAVYRMT